MLDIDLDRPPAPRDTRPIASRIAVLIGLALLAGYLPSAQPPVVTPWSCATPPVIDGVRGAVVMINAETGEAICQG